MVLVYFFMARHNQLPALARSHLEQTISAGLWIAVMFLLGGVTIMIMRLSGIEDVTLWIIVVLVPAASLMKPSYRLYVLRCKFFKLQQTT